MIFYKLIFGHKPISASEIIQPSIPENRLLNENHTIPRICVSKTLDGCATALGPSTIGLNALMSALDNDTVDNVIKDIHAGQRMLLPFTILIFDLPNDSANLLETSDVSRYVEDAWLTNECWLLKATAPTSVSFVWLVDGLVEPQFLHSDGQKVTYYTIRNSLWSETKTSVSQNFQMQILSVVYRYLEQD